MSHQVQAETEVFRPSLFNVNPSYTDRKPDLPGRLMRWFLNPDTVLEKANSVVQNGFALTSRVREDLITAGVAFSDVLAEKYKTITTDYDHFSEELDLLKTLTRNMSFFELKKRSGRLSVRAAEFDYKVKSFSHSTLKAMNLHRRRIDKERENAIATTAEVAGTDNNHPIQPE